MMSPKRVDPVKGGGKSPKATYQSRIKQAKGQATATTPNNNSDYDNNNHHYPPQQQQTPSAATTPSSPIPIATEPPVLDPYAVKLERFELFSTNQCYYLVGCNKLNTAYRVLKMDRTLIERPPAETNHHPPSYATPSTAPAAHAASPHRSSSASTGRTTPTMMRSFAHPHSSSSGNSAAAVTSATSNPTAPSPSPRHTNTTTSTNTNQPHLSSQEQAALADNSHTAKPTYRPLTDFLTEDPNVYTQDEIKDMLDMIHDGNRMTIRGNAGKLGGSSGGAGGATSPGPHAGGGGASAATTGGLKPIVKAYGIVGFIRFLDCYYLTLITRRSKVGSIGGNSIYTIKVRTERRRRRLLAKRGASLHGSDP